MPKLDKHEDKDKRGIQPKSVTTDKVGPHRPKTYADRKKQLKITEPLSEELLHRLAQRQKQVDYGKNTKGYQNYIKLIPKSERKPQDPKTPDALELLHYSKRAWDGIVRKWRRQLHDYDHVFDDEANTEVVSITDNDVQDLATINEMLEQLNEQ